jgi:hypothetical protein
LAAASLTKSNNDRFSASPDQSNVQPRTAESGLCAASLVKPLAQLFIAQALLRTFSGTSRATPISQQARR